MLLITTSAFPVVVHNFLVVCSIFGVHAAEFCVSDSMCSLKADFCGRVMRRFPRVEFEVGGQECLMSWA